MKETERDPGRKPAAPQRPAWVDEQDDAVSPRPRRERLPRQPAPGKHEDDGLWEHALVTGILVAMAAWAAAVLIPHSVPWWMISCTAATIAAVVWWSALNLADSVSMAMYLGAWGAFLSVWITAARVTSPWHGKIIFALLLPVLVFIPAGVTVIRRHRYSRKKSTEIGRDNVNTRQCRYWQDLLPRLEMPGITVRDVINADGGYEVHCRLDKAADGRRVHASLDADAARRICVHKRLPKGAVYINEEPEGATGGAADFVIHVRTVTGPRLTRYLPAENGLLSVNDKFALGVHDTGKAFRLRLREVVVFICGLRGSGKSTLLNIFVAQLCRMPDALIFMIDLKGGQEARAWLMPWLLGWTDRPVIDWLATTREEADIMLDALKRGGYARAESGKYGKKLRPSPEAPAIIPICDESTVMTGHQIREDGLSNTKLATKLLQVAETFRSAGIDPIVAAVRAVVDATGKSGYKAMSDVRIGMRVSTAEEGRMIFPDNPAAAKQLAQLRDRGMGIPKVSAELYPPVHFFNITDGEPDDDGHPTEDRITPIVLATTERRPEPEQCVIDAMNTVRVKVGDKDRGAYEARWEQPHIKQLMAKWVEEAGSALPPPSSSEPPPAPGGSGDAFEDIIAADPLLSELNEAPDDVMRPGQKLHPAYKRMRELLIECKPNGYKPGELHERLRHEGKDVARETVQRWLNADEKKGYVFRTGKPSSRWIWRLPPGAEFDLPGMD